MKTYYRWLLSFAAIVLAFTVSKVKAAPYASGITNNAGNIQFYLNESGGSTTVTFEDGTTNDVFTDIYGGTNLVGTNMVSGYYSFPLGSHSSYAIAVTKFGTGAAGLMDNAIQNTNFFTAASATNKVIFGNGDPRGIAINVNPASPYFGRMYTSRGGSSTTPPNVPSFFDFNGDGSLATVGQFGTNCGYANFSLEGHAVSPNRLSIASNDDVVVSDWSVANAGIWLLDPNLTTNQLLLGPIGSASGTVHGGIVSRPLVLGDLTNGANVLQVDGTYNPTNSAGPYNCILVYSNITLSAISSGSGWTTAANKVGPEVAVNAAETIGSGVYLYPSLCVGPNGYIYSGEYRSGPSKGTPGGVQVYDQNLNSIWRSDYTNGSTSGDYFNTSVSGGSACLPTCVAVSPDGQYLCAVGYDGHFNICLLTNGIPNLASLYTVRPYIFTSSPGYGQDNEIAWDAADNLYLYSGSSSILGIEAWTLGLSSTCTTYGNATGSTNFSNVSLTPTISVYATNPPVISQQNSYGNPTNGTFTIVRTGPAGATTTVNIKYSGTATNGTYITGAASAVVLQPGQTVTNIPISAVTDGIDRQTIYLTLTIQSSMNYDIGAGSATISIMNTAMPELIPSTGQSSMYNAFSNDYVSVVVTRIGDTNTIETLSASGLTLGGTAGLGTDYNTPSTVTFNPGDFTKTIYINPLVAGQLPTHNPNLPYTGNKTVTVKIANGSNFNGNSATVTLNILDSGYPAAQVLYFNPLTNSMDVTNWDMAAGDDNMSQLSPDVDAIFGDNLYTAPSFYNGYTFNPIPAPPNGASNALMVTVNKLGGPGVNGGPGTAVNFYMTNQMFSGNYAVRFNMNVIEGDCTPEEVGSFNPEECVLFGINHGSTAAGFQTNLFFPSFGLGETYTNWPADGVFYAISDSGGRYNNIYKPYQGFIGNGSATTNKGWAFTTTLASSTYAIQFKTNIFTCYASANIPANYEGGWTEGGPGLPVNGSQTLGLSMNSWADVELKQIGKVESLWIDKTEIMAYTNNTGLYTNGYIMLGYEDPYDGGESPDTAAYYSNLRVVALTPPTLSGGAYNSSTSKLTFNFTSSDGDLTASSFSVYGATNLLSGFTSVSGATISQILGQSGTEEFQATVPVSGPVHFYQIVQH